MRVCGVPVDVRGGAVGAVVRGVGQARAAPRHHRAPQRAWLHGVTHRVVRQPTQQTPLEPCIPITLFVIDGNATTNVTQLFRI